MYRQHREYQSYQYQSETKKQQFWALSYRTSIELYGNNNWKIMDFTRRLVGSKPKLFWMFWDRSKWPQSRRPSLYWESSSVRCPKKTKSGMDGWSLVDFLDCVFFFVCFLHDVPWFIFPLDTIRYGIGHCIRMFRFEGCEWSQIVGIGWTESDVGAIYVEDRCGLVPNNALIQTHIPKLEYLAHAITDQSRWVLPDFSPQSSADMGEHTYRVPAQLP